MSSAIEKLNVVTTSLACRVAMLVFGIVMLGGFGISILANFINPMSWADFLIALYFAIAGVSSFIQFFTKKLPPLLIALPAAIYLCVAFILWPP